MNKILLILLVSIATNGYAESKFQISKQADLPFKSSEISYDQAGKIIELVTSQWNDRIKTKDGVAYFTYKQGFSYAKKQGFLKIFNNDGELVEEKWNKSIVGGMAQEEVLIAFEIVKNNDIVKKQFEKTKEAIMLYGGFNYKDNTECVPGNRCLHIITSTLDRTVLSHSIVRLTDSKVVYPEFKMGKHKKRKFKAVIENQTKRKL